MDAYIVQFRTNLDDFVVAAYPEKAKAYGYAKRMRRVPKKILAIYDVDEAGPINVSVVEIRNGKPVSLEIIKRITNEQD